jgi:hypothetical protein
MIFLNVLTLTRQTVAIGGITRGRRECLISVHRIFPIVHRGAPSQRMLVLNTLYNAIPDHDFTGWDRRCATQFGQKLGGARDIDRFWLKREK